MDRTTVAIVGNGFDLSLDLPTSYSDFIKSSEFLDLNDNLLVAHLKSVNEKSGWVDIEAELKAYGQLFIASESQLDSEHKVKAEHFREEYLELKDALCSYLIRCTSHHQLTQPNNAKAFVENLIEDNTLVFNFNYTNTFQAVANWNYFDNLFYVHGSIIKDSIIFGVEDTPSLHEEHRLIQKSFATNFSTSLTKALMSQTLQKVVVYGHSLGKSDHDYFRAFFKRTDLEPITLKIYHYGEIGKERVNTQIQDMAGGFFSEFRANIGSIEYWDTARTIVY